MAASGLSATAIPLLLSGVLTALTDPVVIVPLSPTAPLGVATKVLMARRFARSGFASPGVYGSPQILLWVYVEQPPAPIAAPGRAEHEPEHLLLLCALVTFR